MNPDLTYRMAQYHQQDLSLASDRARAARGLWGQRRSAGLRRAILNVRFTRHPQAAPQARPQAARQAAGGVAA